MRHPRSNSEGMCVCSLEPILLAIEQAFVRLTMHRMSCSYRINKAVAPVHIKHQAATLQATKQAAAQQLVTRAT